MSRYTREAVSDDWARSATPYATPRADQQRQIFVTACKAKRRSSRHEETSSTKSHEGARRLFRYSQRASAPKPKPGVSDVVRQTLPSREWFDPFAVRPRRSPGAGGTRHDGVARRHAA